jgi:hypothetical protein
MAIGKVFSTKRAVFMGLWTNHAIFILTEIGGRVLLFVLQPKSGFLPEAGRGRPKFRRNSDGANEIRQLISRPLSRPSPTANLAGNWKGDS